MFRRHPLLSVVTFVYLGIVGWLTLGPQPLDDEANGLLFRVLEYLDRNPSTAWVSYNGLEFTANIAMFVPVGLFFLLLLGRSSWFVAVLAGVGLTFAIETAQLFLPERVSDPRDLASNSIGALVGVVAALIVTTPKARRLKREAAERRAALAAAAARAARERSAEALAGRTR
ncbi:VanZ family protein [Lysobacter korlensis]|uniref:VanZ family protein n=1 Tax=Lysobacter korlensis TaxID=553636 RepID=A0ABV6S0H7_9GAMM